MKADVLQNLLETEIDEFNTFTFRDYIKIVNKIYEKKKPMFDQFRDSTPKFKAFIFWVLKKIYEEENIPDNFHETSLIALFKKGDCRDPSNYRYLQVKKYLPRMFEDAVYLKVEATFDQKTPASGTLSGISPPSSGDILLVAPPAQPCLCACFPHIRLGFKPSLLASGSLAF